MTLEDYKKIDIPENPGIYFFKKGKKILYVGKATSLRDRVRSYFSRDLIDVRGPLIIRMVQEADTIEWKVTNSVLEALILEAYTIKTHQPPANTKEKDNKSYNYVVITDEDFPRILIERGRTLDSKLTAKTYKLRATFGPFPNGTQLKAALKIVRKLFPYRDKCIPYSEAISHKLKTKSLSPKPCFNRQIGLCPGVCTGEISTLQYKKIIKNIELFFSGKTEMVKKNLTKEMKGYIKTREFEKAEQVKQTLFSLDHIRDVSLIKRDAFSGSQLLADGSNLKTSSFRIEAYDIAHISGSSTVGVMVVMESGELAKKEYRKFKIIGVNKKVTVDDTKNLSEILSRRLSHSEWKFPNFIVIDGGVAQINAARSVLQDKGFDIEIVSVIKDDRHKPKDFLGKKETVDKWSNEILLINNEAHRFAIAYHRNLRKKNFRGKY